MCGKPDSQELHLHTLELVFLRGKLKMWGRWSHITKTGGASGILSRMLSKQQISKTAINAAIKQMKEAGISKDELLAIFGDINNPKGHSSLIYCTDTEGLLIDSIVGGILKGTPGLINIIHQHYIYRKSRYCMAEEMAEAHPEMSFATCRRRIDVWMNTAEYMLYKPLSNAFFKDIDRFRKKRFDYLSEKYMILV
ncbi:ATP-dependent Zn protease [Yersinia kristensenii]|uniref:ATP-dependent Zn protease n=2 Tax=Yersiniaceae TaxID=1903411 RepID=A0AB73Q7B8_YERKR|nr:ATP-dependent Zn protease [Yersinia kristensenii]